VGEKPFIQFYPSDFLGGTSGLSPSERGIYITLLCLIYEADGPIERHDARLARRCGAPKAAFLKALDALISEGKILHSDGMLSNERAEKAIMDRSNRVQISHDAAKKRWSAQRQKNKQKQGQNYAAALPEQCGGICQPEPEPEYTPLSPQGGRVPSSKKIEKVKDINAMLKERYRREPSG
jgi:uncharacterized protein YdaU (DUF1376 family)